MALSPNEVKAKQLGMPFGTASGRLRKLLLFHYVKLAGHDICFKCSTKIETIEEFSIEHKQPWLYISSDLFWDLENIAFSHLKCNKPDRPGRYTGHRKIGPKGTAWCRRHKEFLPISQFGKDKEHWNGLQKLCKSCNHYWR